MEDYQKERERQRGHMRKITGLLWENWEKLDETKSGGVKGGELLLGTAVLCRFTRMGKVGGLLLSSVIFGTSLHLYFALSRDIVRLCDADTPLGNTLRFHFQQISVQNMRLPYFHDATMRISEARNKSNPSK